MAQFILRVDDCGWTPDKTDDRGLEYFRSWREAFGVAGLPVYYGFIPTTLGIRELDWLNKNLEPEEKISLHGYSHERDENLAEPSGYYGSKLERGAVALSLGGYSGETYIAPFNQYTDKFFDQLAELFGRYWALTRQPGVFFGGFPDDPQSVNTGPYPTLVRNTVIHVPAYRPLYGRVGDLLNRVGDYLDLEYPIVVTLHCTWDAGYLHLLPHLLDKLRPHLCSTVAIRDWMRQRGAVT